MSSSSKLQKIIFFFFMLISVATLAGFLFSSHDYKYSTVFIFLCVILPVYFINTEFFILLILFVSEEGFYLLPRTQIGRANYQDLLYFAVLLLLLVGYLFKKTNAQKTDGFRFFVITFLCLVFIGIFNSYYNGQPFILSLKAAKYYFLLLFYFIFSTRKIDMGRLIKLLIITGFLLSMLNNIQYLRWGDISIFNYERALMRVGVLRLLIGGFFIIFSALMAFGEYLRTNKKIYLSAFLYMAATVILQGQTRMIIAGLLISISLMLYFSKKLNFIKALFLSGILIVLLTWLAPIIAETTFFGKLVNLTREEIEEKEGSFGIRLKGYEYYLSETMKSPVLGRGIWNDNYTSNKNPENVKRRGIHISDLGILDILFRFGLLGLIWMAVLFTKAYKVLFKNIMTQQGMYYGILGYFLFGIFSMLTLDCFFTRSTIMYFCVALVLIQNGYRGYKKNLTDSSNINGL